MSTLYARSCSRIDGLSAALGLRAVLSSWLSGLGRPKTPEQWGESSHEISIRLIVCVPVSHLLPEFLVSEAEFHFDTVQ